MSELAFLRTTRASYDAVAADYAVHFRDELAALPIERAMLAGFVELVQGLDAGPVADIGCGTGLITAYLHDLGLDIFGIDLSANMVEVARRHHPSLRFEEGSMLALDLPDGGLGGVVAWYSTIHIPDAQLPQVMAEIHRVLAPGGYVLLGFQVGEGRLHLTEALGHAVSLDFHRRRPEHVTGPLTETGLAMCAQVLREPIDGEGVEPTQKAYLLARKPAEPRTPT